MNVDISEKELIYILNSLNITLHYMKWHTLDEKKFLNTYFNLDDNYYDVYYFLDLIYKRLSLKGNLCFYNLSNEIFFEGQKNYLCNFKNSIDILKRVV